MPESKFKIGDVAWHSDTESILQLLTDGTFQKVSIVEVIQRTNSQGTKEKYEVTLWGSGHARNFDTLLTKEEAMREFDKRRSAEFLRLFG